MLLHCQPESVTTSVPSDTLDLDHWKLYRLCDSGAILSGHDGLMDVFIYVQTGAPGAD